MNSNVLFITGFHPGGMGFIGAGEAISQQHIERLIKQGRKVHVLALAPNYQVASPEVVASCASYTTLTHTRWMTFAALWRSRQQGSLLCPWLFTRVSPQAERFIRQLLDQHAITEIYLDFPSCLGFAPTYNQLPIHYIVHDVLSQKVERRPLLKWLKNQVLRTESSLLRHVTQCFTLSLKDKLRCEEIGYSGQIEVQVPHILKVGVVNQGVPIAGILKQFPGKKNLVFFGNMQRAENHYSILRFLLCSYPGIWLEHRDVQCWILGLAPRTLLRWISKVLPGVRVTGAVDDPTEAFKAATLCIAPVYYGAGVKIKVLQMLESGATVISTPVGAEGIHGSEKLITVESARLSSTIKQRLAVES
ncbi:glycosyltransferase [Methylobacillus glycogenes]|uniref:glycosyltransferase n=1 Tax=Methylobacillus glycogenes TaxID=406 RepID=UPI00046F6B07|nr:glycosyltransferase family 4 protein [Methylobacillus glycogenes]